MSAPVLHAEVPGFYAEVERAADPALRGRPVLVGGDPRKRGLVQSATWDAVAAGVRTDMPVLDALERCPRARALRTRMPFYREAARRLRASLGRVGGALESDGLGGAYLLSDPKADPLELARALREAVHAELGLPLRVGIAGVKELARLASGCAADTGVCHVRPGREREFLAPLPASRLPFIGPNAEQRLAQAGARTVGEALALGAERLEALLGNPARDLLELAAGRGDARVRAAPAPGSLSQEATLEAPCSDPALLGEALARIAEGLEAALRLEGLVARRVGLKVQYEDQRTVSRTTTLSRGVSDRAELEAVAAELLARTDAGERPVRLLGLTLRRLGPRRRDGRQLDLFGA